MRLSEKQVTLIKSAAAEVLGDQAQVWLFGSRVDDQRRGGDIDLYVELPADMDLQRVALETQFWTRLQRDLGEQRIDIVTHVAGTPIRPIDQQARATGICL